MKYWIFATVGIMVGILVFFWGSYYVTHKPKKAVSNARHRVQKEKQITFKKVPLTATPTPVPPTAIPTPVPIKPGWKLFQNTRYSFIYPEGAVIQNKIADSVSLKYYDSNVHTISYTIQVSTLPKSDAGTVQQLASQEQESAGVECNRNADISQLSNLEISSKNAQEFTITNCYGPDISTQYFVDDDKELIQIQISSKGSSGNELYQNITSNMLSSFKVYK